MLANALFRLRLLFSTSPEIERRPLLARPRTMAAVWGGLLVCKLFAIVAIDATSGIAAFAVVFIAGVAAAQWRFRDGVASDQPALVPARIRP